MGEGGVEVREETESSCVPLPPFERRAAAFLDMASGEEGRVVNGQAGTPLDVSEMLGPSAVVIAVSVSLREPSAFARCI